MKLIIEVELSDTRNPCNPCVKFNLPGGSTAIDDTAKQSEQAEKAFEIRLLVLALALFSPLALPILCYLGWLYFTGSLQQMAVADILIWIAPLYAMIAALTIVATPLIERGIIRLYRSLPGEHRCR